MNWKKFIRGIPHQNGGIEEQISKLKDKSMKPIQTAQQNEKGIKKKSENSLKQLYDNI